MCVLKLRNISSGARSLGLSGSIGNLVNLKGGITRIILIPKLLWLRCFPFCERILLRGCVRESGELRILEKIRNFRLVISF